MAIRGPEGFRTHISKKVGCIDVDVCQKINFDKTFSSFLIIFHLQRGLFRPKGRSPTRASVRTQASEIKRRESRNALNEKTRVLRQRCDGVEQAKREQSGTLRPASEDVDRRARVSEETQASRGRRGRARGTPAANAPADAPVRVSELLRSPQRARHFVKIADGPRKNK